MSKFGLTGDSRLARVVSGGGVDELSKRLARKAYRATGAAELEFPLRTADITDSSRVHWTEAPVPPESGRPLTVAWICAPPGPGSGGHTTMFRMMRGLEEAGHTCVLYLYDPYGVDLARFTDIVRRHWPEIAADVVDIDTGLRQADAFVATSWQTAHVLGSRPDTPGRRMYFVQDYEPYFYPRGSEYALAEDTYRFGFDILALGQMMRDEIRSTCGVDSTVIPFGCDTDTYGLRSTGAPRSGIAFYSRPDTARRGSVLAGLALDIVHDRMPDQQIHLIGTRPSSMRAPVVEHGRMTPDELASLYNSTICGIGISFTNISLVVEEMALCGCVPVVNDDPLARAGSAHPDVAWVPPTPSAIADAVCALASADAGAVAHRAAMVAARWNGCSWTSSVQELVLTIESRLGASADTRRGR